MRVNKAKVADAEWNDKFEICLDVGLDCFSLGIGFSREFKLNVLTMNKGREKEEKDEDAKVHFCLRSFSASLSDRSSASSSVEDLSGFVLGKVKGCFFGAGS